jgi:GTP cyclohydrolase I
MSGQPIVATVDSGPQTNRVAVKEKALLNLEGTIRSMLSQLGEDIFRPGLRETPTRVAKMYRELLTPQDFTFTTFDADGYDEMIVESNIEFFSLCEHHLVPFFGSVTIGYIPKGKVCGLSKLSRAVESFARRLQMQERMTSEIAQFLQTQLDPVGVGVIIHARHLCQEMRGVKKRNLITTTSAMLGAMRDNASARAEFLSLTKE